MTKFREKQQQCDAVEVPKRERGKTIRFSSPSILLMARNLHGEHSVSKCELGQSHAGKEKHGEKKKSLTVDTVLSITALHDRALPRTLYSTSRYS